MSGIISYTELEDKVKSMIKPSRFEHSLGVVEMSEYLASKFSLDSEVARYIGIYHDAYRYSCDETTPSFCIEHGIGVFPEEKENPMLLHGALAAIHFSEDAEGEVPDFYRIAVRHHTLGSRDMGLYGAILYIADYAEKGRKHLSEKERGFILSQNSLEKMIIVIMDAQREYFRKEGIANAAVSDELYSFLKNGGQLA